MFKLLKGIRFEAFHMMALLGILVGILGGLGAVGFRLLIQFFQGLAFGANSSLPGWLDYLYSLPWYQRLLIPCAGGLIVGPLIYFFAREAKGHGVPEVMEAVALRAGRIRKRVVLVKSLASSITIGTGGSVGREGPIVQIGSAIGSSLGQILGISGESLKTLVACGAAAGIAATFNAPIAGVMFSIEIILGDLAVSTFTPVVLSSVMAIVVSRPFLGSSPAFIVPTYSFVSPWEILTYIVLGGICGFVALSFTTLLYKTEDLFSRIKWPEYAQAALGGIIIGLLGIFFPHLFGVGYKAIDLALNQKLIWHLALILAAVKLLATSITIGSGGSGGIFAPSLFLGSMIGGFFGILVHNLFPSITATSGAYALVAMGAVVAGATHAPMTAIIILFELTGDYMIILPLMISCVISTLLTTNLKRGSIYTLKLIRRGVELFGGKEVNVLKSVLVQDVMTTEVETIPENIPLKKLLEFIPNSRHINFPLVDDQGMLTGTLSFQDFKEIVFEKGLEDLVVAKELAKDKVISIMRHENLDDALVKMGKWNVDQLPVVHEDNPNKLVGVLSRSDIISAYNKALVDRSLSGVPD